MRARPTILIAVDESDQADDALALGRLMCEARGARPIVTTVLGWPSDLLSPEHREITVERDARELLESARQEFTGLDADTRHLVNPSVTEALYEIAEAERATLIVVGSSRRGPLGRVVPGRIGFGLLQGAPCAVLVASRGYADSRQRPGALAVAFDGSDESWTALDRVVELAERWNAKLTILAVAEEPRQTNGTVLSGLTAEEHRAYEQEEKRRLLDLALERARGHTDVAGRLLAGKPGSTLVGAAEDFDFMALGSRGYGPAKRVFLGSTSTEIAGSAPCPLLVVPRDAEPGARAANLL